MVLRAIRTWGKPFSVQEELKGAGGTLAARDKRGVIFRARVGRMVGSGRGQEPNRPLPREAGFSWAD